MEAVMRMRPEPFPSTAAARPTLAANLDGSSINEVSQPHMATNGGDDAAPTGNNFDPLAATAVYDGQTLLGFVHEKGDHWVALGHDEQRIGSYANRKLAT